MDDAAGAQAKPAHHTCMVHAVRHACPTQLPRMLDQFPKLANAAALNCWRAGAAPSCTDAAHVPAAHP